MDEQFDTEQKLVPPEGDENSKRLVGVGLLSNFEVYQFFKETKEGNTRGPKHANKWKYNTHLNTVTYEVLQYLQKSPSVTQSPEIIEQFVRKLQPYHLTKPEVLTILNTRPTGAVDIQAIVEESEERLTEQQIDEILDIVEEMLPPLTVSEEEKAEGNQE